MPNSENDLFELMTKMYSEMQSGFNGINTEIKEIKEDQKRTNEKLANLENKVDNIDTKVVNLETKVDALDTKVVNLETKVDALDTKVVNLETKVDALDTKVVNLETKVDEGFTRICNDISKLIVFDVADTLSDMKCDISFIKHKLSATEEDVYKIQTHLKIVK